MQILFYYYSIIVCKHTYTDGIQCWLGMMCAFEKTQGHLFSIAWSLLVLTQWQYGLYCQLYYLWPNLMCLVGNFIGLFVEMEISPTYGAYGSTFRRHQPKCVHKITIQEWQTAGLFHCWLKLISLWVFDTSRWHAYHQNLQ